LADLVRRGGVNFSKEGFTLEQAAAAAAVSTQSEALPLANTLRLDPETERRVSELKQASVPIVVREQQTRIRCDLEKLNLLPNHNDLVRRMG
jgi:hypothetical protein